MNSPEDYNEIDFFKDVTYGHVSKNISDIDVLINNIIKYDMYDFIARVSALNLLIENQNKSIILDAIIGKILRKKHLFTENAPKMSPKKFKNIIKIIEGSELSTLVDPPENLFVERIRYYGNHWVLNGINYAPAYSLQSFIDVIYFRKNLFSEDFFSKANIMINFIIMILDTIVEKLNYNLDTNIMTFEKEIKVPSSEKMDILKNCLVIDLDWVKYMIEDENLINSLFYKSDLLVNEDMYSDNQEFFKHPFLQMDENNVLILNPTILVSFLIHKLILIAKEHNECDVLINTYNELIFENCNKYLGRLGHYAIDESKYKIQLINNNYRKEKLLTIGTSKLLLVNYVCDPVVNYDDESMFEEVEIQDDLPRVEERIEYFCKYISNSNKENIYVLNIINGIGRVMMLMNADVAYTKSIKLSPYELMCVSINEASHKNFLAKYINSKTKINCLETSILISELNIIEVYTSQGYSFYASDDFDIKSMRIFMPLGDSLNYIIKAIKTEDRHLVESYDGIHLREIVRYDKLRPIYYSENILNNGLEFLVKLKNINIWIITPIPKSSKEINIYRSISDLLSYWVAECKEYIEKLKFCVPVICVDIKLSSNIEEYLIEDEKQNMTSSIIDYDNKGNIITMSWSSEVFKSLKDIYNTTEKEIIKSLILELNKLSDIEIDISNIDYFFENPIKKKAFGMDINNFPILKPVWHHFTNISEEDTDILLDEIGNYFLETKEYTIGKVPDKSRAELANNVVGYLYNLLKKELSELSPQFIYEAVYLDLESVLYESSLNHARYIYDCACYPERKDEFMKYQNRIDEASVSLKFLMEYIAACPPSGETIMDTIRYDRILAICHLIINWAYNNDLFYYGIFNTPVEFLKSGRIGMKRDEEYNLAQLNYHAKMRKLEEISNPKVSGFFAEQALTALIVEIDSAFIDECGYSFSDFSQFIDSLFSYGEMIEDEIKKCKIKDALEYISKDTGFSEDKVTKMINQISLKERKDFLKPSKEFRKEDVYPWRFNRELSFIRRPVIQYNDNLIWGNRNLDQMRRYIIDLILKGKYKSRKKQLKNLMGKISNIRGNEFNDAVYKKLSQIESISVYEKVSKINGKKIAGEDNNVLGDIDVLYIIPDKKEIIVGEVKDFSFAKNPYELQQEYKKIFVDGKELCFLTKHRRRASWIKDNIADVIKHYGLEEGKWAVKTVMFVSDDIISKDYFDKDEKIIVYTDINEGSVMTV